MPEELEDRLSVHDFARLLAHYGLQDPERELEREIEYRDAIDDFRIERRQRAIAQIAERANVEVTTFADFMSHLWNVDEALRCAIEREPEIYKAMF